MYRSDLSSPAALVGFAEESNCVKNCQLMGCGAEYFVSQGHWGVLSSSMSSSCCGGQTCGSPPRCDNVRDIISEHFCGSAVAGSHDVGSFSAIVPFVCGFSASVKVRLICDPLTRALCSLVLLFLEICFSHCKYVSCSCDILSRKLGSSGGGSELTSCANVCSSFESLCGEGFVKE